MNETRGVSVNGDDLMGELRGAGAFDSHGAFTVDVTQARRKLRDFSLAQGEMWLVLLLTAAAARGVQSMSVYVLDNRLHVVLHGLLLDAHEFERVGRALADLDATDAFTRDLASGLHALGADPIEIRNGQRCLSVGVGPGLRLTQVAAGPPNDFVISTPARFVNPYLVEERQSLARWCRFAPVRVRIGDHEPDAPFLVEDALVVRVVSRAGENALARLHVGLRGQYRVQHVESEDAVCAVIAYRANKLHPFNLIRPVDLGHHGPHWSGHAVTELVVNGQSFRAPTDGVPYTLSLVADASLHKDASHAALVTDEAFHHRLAWLREQTVAMAVDLARHFRRLPREVPSPIMAARLLQAAVFFDLVCHAVPDLGAETRVHLTMRRARILCATAWGVRGSHGTDAESAPLSLEPVQQAVDAVVKLPEGRRKRAALRDLLSLLELYQKRLKGAWNHLTVAHLRQRVEGCAALWDLIRPTSEDRLDRMRRQAVALGFRAMLAHAAELPIEAEARAQEALSTALEVGARETTAADALHLLGLLHRVRGDFAGGEALHERAAALAPSVFGRDAALDLAFGKRRTDVVLLINAGADDGGAAIDLENMEGYFLRAAELCRERSERDIYEDTVRVYLSALLISLARRFSPRPGLWQEMTAHRKARAALARLSALIGRDMPAQHFRQPPRDVASAHDACAAVLTALRPYAHHPMYTAFLWLDLRLHRMQSELVAAADRVAARLRLSRYLQCAALTYDFHPVGRNLVSPIPDP